MKIKVVKIIAITLATTIMVCVLGTAIAMGNRIYYYMDRQKFDFAMAFEWSIADYKDWQQSIFGNGGEKTIEYYPFTNQKINVEACTSH